MEVVAEGGSVELVGGAAKVDVGLVLLSSSGVDGVEVAAAGAASVELEELSPPPKVEVCGLFWVLSLVAEAAGSLEGVVVDATAESVSDESSPLPPPACLPPPEEPPLPKEGVGAAMDVVVGTSGGGLGLDGLASGGLLFACSPP